MNTKKQLNYFHGNLRWVGNDGFPLKKIEFKDQKVKTFEILDIDHVNTGAFMRNTLKQDKNSNREEALMDVYRVMRPGEPPTLEAAEQLFQAGKDLFIFTRFNVVFPLLGGAVSVFHLDSQS